MTLKIKFYPSRCYDTGRPIALCVVQTHPNDGWKYAENDMEFRGNVDKLCDTPDEARAQLE